MTTSTTDNGISIPTFLAEGDSRYLQRKQKYASLFCNLCASSQQTVPFFCDSIHFFGKRAIFPVRRHRENHVYMSFAPSEEKYAFGLIGGFGADVFDLAAIVVPQIVKPKTVLFRVNEFF